MIKAVIFDMDGVIVDSEELSAKATYLLFQEKGIKVNEKRRPEFVGRTLKYILKTLSEELKTELDIDEMIKERERIYRNISKDILQIFPGVKELVEALIKNDFKLAVASSGTMDKLSFNLEEAGLEDSIKVRICANDVNEGKPDPEIYLKAAEQLGVKPEECVVIEDSYNGVKAAKAAGAKCIAVTHTFQKSKLKEADVIVNSLEEIDISMIKDLG
jgi:HAD superfamily hydrolase (TIGR01509 family)